MVSRFSVKIAMASSACSDGAHLPCIQDIVDAGILHLPPAFIQPAHQRPDCSSDQLVLEQDHIPVIDLCGRQQLSSDQERLQITQEIGRACEEWGFLQVVNHGVPQDLLDRMRAACHKFFGQSAEERFRFRSQNVEDGVAYSTSFNPGQEKVRDWKDVLYIRDLPGKCNGFEKAPEICKEAFQEYREEVQKLANWIYRAIFESLGLSSEYLDMELPEISFLVVGVNYYPPCPDPSLTFGFSGHSDVICLALILQDEVSGLQIRKADKWIPVKPLPNAFVINVGDQIQILTNGIYKSVEHRVVTNVNKTRLSVGCFFGPREDRKIAPLSKLVTESNPARYKEVAFGDYLKNFYSKALQADRATLNFASQDDLQE